MKRTGKKSILTNGSIRLSCGGHYNENKYNYIKSKTSGEIIGKRNKQTLYCTRCDKHGCLARDGLTPVKRRNKSLKKQPVYSKKHNKYEIAEIYY